MAVGAVVLLAAAGGGAWVAGVFGPRLPEAPAVTAAAPVPPPAAATPSPETVAVQAAAAAKAAQQAAAARLEVETQAARATAEAKAAQEATAARVRAAADTATALSATNAAATLAAAQAKAATEAAAEAARALAARDLLARQAAWVAARAPEPCLFLTPLPVPGAVPGETALESLAASTAPTDRLSAEFTAAFGSPPRIVPTAIAPAQCAALDFATALRGPATAGATTAQGAARLFPPPRITLGAQGGVVRGGEMVRGTIDLGGSRGDDFAGGPSAPGAVALFSVGPTGAVTDLGEFLQPVAAGRARFAFPTAWAAPPDGSPDGSTAAPGSVPLLLVAIATDRPVAAFAGLDDGFTADSVMPHLRYWLQEDGQPGTVGLRALTLTP